MNRLKQLAGAVIGKLGSRSGSADESVAPDRITIGVTTFSARFERYLVPLLTRIRECANNEVVVAINGEHKREFDEDYRRKVLSFIAEQANVYPIVFPRFRGLSKLWNTVVIHATHDYVLMLNDDIMIERRDFLEDICDKLRRNEGRTFLINRSWSHFVVSRIELDELGYFDERLLGIGEEDGDMTWRYLDRYRRELASFKIRGFVNYAQESVHSYRPLNIKGHSGTKYSLFNRKFMFEEKYQPSADGIRGMFDEPVVLRGAQERQYPYESFYRRRKDEL